MTVFGKGERLARLLVEPSGSAFRRTLRAEIHCEPDWGLQARLNDYANREGWAENHNNIDRLWTERGFRVEVKCFGKRIGISRVTETCCGERDRPVEC